MANEKIADNEVRDDELSEKELKKIEKKRKKELKKANKKNGGFLKLVLIFLIIFCFVFAFLYFNIFNIRSTYIDESIKGTPIEQIFTNAPGSTFGEEELEYDGEVNSNSSRAELLQEVNRLSGLVEILEEDLDEANELNELYIERINQLQPLADEQLQFKEDKEEFDIMIANGDPDAFVTFYEDVYPTTAEEIYRSLVSEDVSSEEVNSYVAKFTAMDEDKAADILSEMSRTDLNLVVNILNAMSPDNAGIILSEMDAETAATVVRIWLC